MSINRFHWFYLLGGKLPWTKPSQIEIQAGSRREANLPPICAWLGNLYWVCFCILCEPHAHVLVKLTPLLWEKQSTPAARQLVQVGCVGMNCTEEVSCIEMRPFLHNLDNTRWIESYGVQLREPHSGVIVILEQCILEPHVVERRDFDVILKEKAIVIIWRWIPAQPTTRRHINSVIP